MSRLIIGLTGPTGAGKSSVSVLARDMGVQVIDCDFLARCATERGSRGLAALTAEFGSEILHSDLTLDRKRLAAIAFSTRENTERLNRTLLPVIAELVTQEIHAEYVLLDAPTLFESGIDSLCGDTVAVLSSLELRRERIIRRDRLTAEEADLRIGAGKPDEYYIKRAGHIIYNNGDINTCLLQAKQLFVKLFGGNINV